MSFLQVFCWRIMARKDVVSQFCLDTFLLRGVLKLEQQQKCHQFLFSQAQRRTRQKKAAKTLFKSGVKLCHEFTKGKQKMEALKASFLPKSKIEFVTKVTKLSSFITQLDNFDELDSFRRSEVLISSPHTRECRIPSLLD